jgi:hypothetical protein
MKKFLVVLTILVLVAGFAFADIKGSVTAAYTFGFSKVEGGVESSVLSAGYTKPSTAKIDATFSLDSQSAGLTGENMPYAVVEVSASISGYYGYSTDHFAQPAVKQLNFSLSLKTFKIVGEEWELNLLKSSAAVTDFAVSAIDCATFYYDTLEENDAYFTYSNALDYTNGVSLTYKGFVAGMGYNNPDIKNEKADITFEVKTPEFTFGEVTVQAGAGYSQKRLFTADEYTGVQRKAGVSVKAAYASDSVQASVAADAGKVSGDEKITFDVAANVKVAPVTVDFYYASAKAKATSSVKLVGESSGRTTAYALENLLSVKVVVALGDVIENVPVTVTFVGSDLLKKNEIIFDENSDYYGRDWSVSANTTAIENFDLTLTVGGLDEKENLYLEGDVEYTGVEHLTLTGSVIYEFDAKLLGIKAGAKYAAEKYTAKANVLYATDFTDNFFGLSASVESDKIVDGATLKAALAGVDAGVTLDPSLGFKVKSATLTLSCKVAF